MYGEESNISIMSVKWFTVLTVKYLLDHMKKKVSGHYIGGRRGTAGGILQMQAHGDTKEQCV